MAKLFHIAKGISKKKEIPPWFTATVLKETEKAVYVYGYGLTKPNQPIQVDTWLPKSCILEIKDKEETIEVPKNHPMLNMLNNPSNDNAPSKKRASLFLTKKGNERIQIIFPFNHEILAKIKTLPNRKYHPEGKFWSCPFSLDTVKQLQEWGFEIEQLLKEKIENKKLNIKDVSGNIEIPGLKGTLFPFQKQGVAFIEKRNGRALIGDEMGLGKTVQVVAWLQLRQDVRPVIIVTPANAKLVWRNHIKEWMRNYGKIDVLNGTKPSKINADIVIVNYDILKHWLDELKALKPLCVVADEVHFIRNNRAQRTKALKKLTSGVPHFLALSGTFIVNRPAEGFNAINLVDPTLFPSFFKFALRYCDAHHNGYGWDFRGASNTKELHDILVNTIMIRRKKEEVLSELPDKIRAFIPLEIDNRNEYNEIENNFIEWLEENVDNEKAERAKRAETLVKMETLKQIACKGKMKQVIEWIKDFLNSDGGKLVVFAVHKETINTLMKEFKNIAVKFDGSTPENERMEVVKQFQENKNVKLFIGNIQAAGTAITLTASSTVAFVELPWTPGELSQAEDRCHRIGQKNAVNIYYLIAENTIEETIAHLLDTKRQVLDSVLDGVKTDEESLFSELIKKYKKRYKKL